MVPKPCFFIVRPDPKQQTGNGVPPAPGPIVPLVAADELPEWLNIVGVPRELTVEQTIGLCNLGTASKSNGSYAINITQQSTAAGTTATRLAKSTEVKGSDVVNGPPSPYASNYPSPKTAAHGPAPPASAVHPADVMKAHWSEAHARALTAAANTPTPPPGSVTTTVRSQPQTGILPPNTAQLQASPGRSAACAATSTKTASTKDTPNDTLPLTNSHPNNHPNTTTLTSPGNTTTTTNSSIQTKGLTAPPPEYCRHWCHYGTCKWNLHCRYLHAMPTTAASLAEVGLREVPGWWLVVSSGLHHHPHLHGQGDGHAQLNNNAGNVGLDLANGGSPGVGAGGFDPRDVRVGILRRMGLLPPPTPHPQISGGNINNSSKRVMRAHLRETIALLRDLGFGHYGGGYGGGRQRRREKEVNPLEKGRKKVAVEEKMEGFLKRGKGVGAGLARSVHAPAAAAATAAASVEGEGGKQGQIAAAMLATQEKVVEGAKAGPAEVVPKAATPQVAKLVDV